jgi:hypothetical protein
MQLKQTRKNSHWSLVICYLSLVICTALTCGTLRQGLRSGTVNASASPRVALPLGESKLRVASPRVVFVIGHLSLVKGH